jgi:hypothetical protein
MEVITTSAQPLWLGYGPLLYRCSYYLMARLGEVENNPKKSKTLLKGIKFLSLYSKKGMYITQMHKINYLRKMNYVICTERKGPRPG